MTIWFNRINTLMFSEILQIYHVPNTIHFLQQSVWLAWGFYTYLRQAKISEMHPMNTIPVSGKSVIFFFFFWWWWWWVVGGGWVGWGWGWGIIVVSRDMVSFTILPNLSRFHSACICFERPLLTDSQDFLHVRLISHSSQSCTLSFLEVPYQSIGHPHPKPIKLRQAGWPLLSMCICCSGVMTTPVVSGCHWGSQWVPYATEEHTAISHFLLSMRGCWYQYTGSLIIRNMWSLKLWNAHNDQSIPVSIIWSYVYQTPTTFNFSRTILNMDSHLLGN